MKQNVVNLTKIFSYFRGWLKRKKVPHTWIQTPAHISCITTPEGVLRLCCNMVRKKEMYVRAQAKRLHPLTTQKIVEPGASDGYKGLRIESKEYALWCEMFDPDRKPGKGKEFICCRTVLLYFYGSTKVNAF